MNIILIHRPVHARHLLHFSPMTSVWKVPCSNLGFFVKKTCPKSHQANTGTTHGTGPSIAFFRIRPTQQSRNLQRIN